MKNKVSLCNRGLCLQVEGDLANAIGTVVFIAVLTYGLSQAVKSLR
jgi:hypothetical protein